MSAGRQAYLRELLSRQTGELQVRELRFLLSLIRRERMPPDTELRDAIDLEPERAQASGRNPRTN